MNRVRIWVHWNEDWCRITLHDGEEFVLFRGGPTDEGWSARSETYEYDASEDMVRCVMVDEGCDCDGRLANVWEGFWHVDGEQTPCVQVVGNDCIDLPMLRPVWTQGTAYRRDYQAEAAGY